MRLFIIGLSVLAVGGPAAAQDFYFTSSRDSTAGELNYEIYRYQNGNQTRITTTPVIEEHPIFQSSNNWIFGQALGPNGHEEIIKFDLNTPFLPPTPLAIPPITGGHEDHSHPFLAPDQQSLFITTHLESGASLIRRVDLSGNDLGVVVNPGADVGHSPTATTPAGDKLYYSGNQDGDFEIYRCDLSGANSEKLTNNALYDAGATPSPDGTKIAFTRADPFDQCTTHLWLMDHDGSNQTLVTSPLTSGFKWPFGWNGNNEILYVSGENSDYAIYSIDVNGNNKQVLVDSPGQDMHLLPDQLCGTPGPDMHLDNPGQMHVGLPVPFDCDTGGKIYQSYDWTFGDGATATTAQPFAAHVYVNPGPYIVTCTGVDVCSPSGDRIADSVVEILQPAFPGGNQDLLMFTGVNGDLNLFDFNVAFPGDIIEVAYDSWTGQLYPQLPFPEGAHFLVGSLFDPNDPFQLPQPQPFPVGAWIDPFDPNLLFLHDGGLGLLPPAPLLPGGTLHQFLVPPGLQGLDLMLQSAVINQGAPNGFAVSPGKIIQLR